MNGDQVGAQLVITCDGVECGNTFDTSGTKTMSWVKAPNGWVVISMRRPTTKKTPWGSAENVDHLGNLRHFCSQECLVT